MSYRQSKSQMGLFVAISPPRTIYISTVVTITQCIGTIRLRPRLARLHFTHEALFWGFSSMNSSMGGAVAVLINCLAKQLHIYFFLKYALRKRYVEWGEAERSHYFLLLPIPKLCESTFLGASSVEPFYFTPFGRKRLQAAPEAAREALPNEA